MEHLTLPIVGASFKKWGCYTPIPGPFAKFPKIIMLIKKNSIKWKQGLIGPSVDPQPAGD
jgi:hypothetical protein